jgi:hypothetical protein
MINSAPPILVSESDSLSIIIAAIKVIKGYDAIRKETREASPNLRA